MDTYKKKKAQMIYLNTDHNYHSFPKNRYLLLYVLFVLWEFFSLK